MIMVKPAEATPLCGDGDVQQNRVRTPIPSQACSQSFPQSCPSWSSSCVDNAPELLAKPACLQHGERQTLRGQKHSGSSHTCRQVNAMQCACAFDLRVQRITLPAGGFHHRQQISFVGRRRSRCSGLPHGGVTQFFCYHTSLLCFLVNNMNTTFLIAI